MDKRIDLEDLRSDVAMNPGKMNARHRKRFLYGFQRLARFERKAEFGIDLPGAHKIVGVRINTRLDAKEDLCCFFGGLSQSAQ